MDERSDAEIARLVRSALERDVEVPAADIAETVDCGRVTLEGTVTWPYEKDAAERAVRALGCAAAVANRLRVRYPSPHLMMGHHRPPEAADRERDAASRP